MSEETEVSVPPMIRQSQIIQELSTLLPERVSGEWVALTLTERSLSMYGQGEMHAKRPNGAWESVRAPRSKNDLLKELRALMYRPGSGTWFSTTWTVTKSATGESALDVTFNYDKEPDWTRPVRPFNYVLDLEDFPRDDEHIPEWLRQKITEGKGEAQ